MGKKKNGEIYVDDKPFYEYQSVKAFVTKNRNTGELESRMFLVGETIPGVYIDVDLDADLGEAIKYIEGRINELLNAVDYLSETGKRALQR